MSAKNRSLIKSWYYIVFKLIRSFSQIFELSNLCQVYKMLNISWNWMDWSSVYIFSLE